MWSPIDEYFSQVGHSSFSPLKTRKLSTGDLTGVQSNHSEVFYIHVWEPEQKKHVPKLVDRDSNEVIWDSVQGKYVPKTEIDSP